MNAMRKAQEAAQLAADYWLVYEGTTGVRGDKERAQEAEHSMFKWATLAQAEAAERQAAAMELANEIAKRAADPFKAYATLEAAARESAAQKDAEIARLRDALLAVRVDSGWGFLGNKDAVRNALALTDEEEQRANDKYLRANGQKR